MCLTHGLTQARGGGGCRDDVRAREEFQHVYAPSDLVGSRVRLSKEVTVRNGRHHLTPRIQPDGGRGRGTAPRTLSSCSLACACACASVEGGVGRGCSAPHLPLLQPCHGAIPQLLLHPLQALVVQLLCGCSQGLSLQLCSWAHRRLLTLPFLCPLKSIPRT